MRLLTVVLAVFFVFYIAFAAVTQNNHFEVVPENLKLNWTNNYSSDVYLYFNRTNMTIEVLNSTPFQSLYSQQNTLTKCQYNSQGYMLTIFDRNTSYYNNTFNYSVGSNVTVSLIDLDHMDCKPGRYYASIAFIDAHNTTEKTNVTVYIDIPINQQNSPLINYGIASFNGSMQQGNHSFYFNSSLVNNATGVLIKTVPMEPFAIFLFDDQNLLSKSAGEELVSNVEKDKIYEIRLSGNQSYSGTIIFTGLNTSIERLDFGILNVSQNNFTTFKLENSFGIEEQQIKESIVLNHVDKFSYPSSKNFTFLVPENVTSIKAVLNWSSNAIYSMNLYYNNVLQKSSLSMQNTFKNASVNPEEYIYISNPSPGFWTIEVKNHTQPTVYDLTIYQSLPSFISTNLSSSFNLGDKEFTEINATLSIPSYAWDGEYEGYIKYNSSRGGTIKLPFSFNVTSPLLIINNSFLISSIKIQENYGKNASYELLLPINNTGSYSVNISFLSSNKLYYSSNEINITTPSFINLQPKSNGLASINFTFNSSAPIGTYVGWIMLNTTGNETERSHPRNFYNISVELTLTDGLLIDFLEIKSANNNQIIRNSSKEENVTARFKIYYINRTEVESGNQLNTSNFQVWLEHMNLSYRVPTSGSLNLFNATNPIFWDEDYEINFTVPPNKLGGKYNVYLMAKLQKDQFNYTGIGYNSTLLINNTALSMQTPNSSISLEPSQSTNFLVQVNNYGERNTQTYTLRLNESCSGYSVSASSISGCSGSTSGDTFTISTINAYSSCQFVWTIQAGSTNASSCTAHVIASPPDGWYDPAAINFSVVVRNPQTPSTTTTVLEEEIPLEEKEIKYFSVETDTKILVEQGKNKTLNVKIKNLYSTRQTIKLSLSSINSSWFIVSPTENTIAKSDYYIYRIIFNIPKDAVIGDYTGKIKIESTHHTEEVPITLTVLPGEDLKLLINSTINQYSAKLDELLIKFNNTQNETIKIKLEEIKNKVNELKSYLTKNDYSSAYSKLYEVKKLFDELQYFEKAENIIEKPKSNFSWPLVLIGTSGALFVSALGYTAFESIKKKGFSFSFTKKPKIDTKKELKEIKQSLKLKELENEIKIIKEKEKEIEEEIKKIEENEKDEEKS